MAALIAVITQLRTQQQRRRAYVFLAIFKDTLPAVFAPSTFADSLGDGVLVDALPALDSVGTASVGKAFPRLLPGFVGVVWQQNVTRGQISRVQIEDVSWKPPT
jgi:hypothetical protein